MFSLIFLARISFSENYGLYYFSQNIGQSFYDYSESGYHAING